MPRLQNRHKTQVEAGLKLSGSTATRVTFDLGTELRDVLLDGWRRMQAIGLGGTFHAHIKEIIRQGVATAPQIAAVHGAMKRAYTETRYHETLALLGYFRERVAALEQQAHDIAEEGKCLNCGHSWIDLGGTQVEGQDAEQPEAYEPPPEENP